MVPVGRWNATMICGSFSPMLTERHPIAAARCWPSMAKRTYRCRPSRTYPQSEKLLKPMVTKTLKSTNCPLEPSLPNRQDRCHQRVCRNRRDDVPCRARKDRELDFEAIGCCKDRVLVTTAAASRPPVNFLSVGLLRSCAGSPKAHCVHVCEAAT